MSINSSTECANAKQHEKNIILQFINCYREHPALWKVKSQEYSNKIERNKGIVQLVEILKELEPECTRDGVMKKINSLRSAFRREHKKHENSKKSGAATNEVYTPSLWYYGDMLFTLDQDMPRESHSNLETLPKDSDDEVCKQIANIIFYLFAQNKSLQ